MDCQGLPATEGHKAEEAMSRNAMARSAGRAMTRRTVSLLMNPSGETSRRQAFDANGVAPAGWFRVQCSLIRDHGSAIGPLGIAVYACLAFHANQDGRCWPSRKRIAEEIGASLSTVKRTLPLLQEHGLITFHPSAGKLVNVYQLTGFHGTGSVGTGSNRPLNGFPQTPQRVPTDPLTRPKNQTQEPDPLSPDEPATEKTLFQESQSKRSDKPRKLTKRDELFDAVAEVTASDPRASGSFIGRVCKALREAEPAYSAAEVSRLPGILEKRGFSLPLTLGTIPKYIGWTRSPPPKNSNSIETKEQRDARILRERAQHKEREANAAKIPLRPSKGGNA